MNAHRAHSNMCLATRARLHTVHAYICMRDTYTYMHCIPTESSADCSPDRLQRVVPHMQQRAENE